MIDRTSWQDITDGPTPGQSLTAPLGNSTYETPPKYDNAEDALEAVFEAITQPDKMDALYRIMSMPNGPSAEYIANTIVLGGFAEGNWTPDVGILMIRTVIQQVAAVAHGAGVKDFKIMEDSSNDVLEYVAELSMMELDDA